VQHPAVELKHEIGDVGTNRQHGAIDSEDRRRVADTTSADRPAIVEVEYTATPRAAPSWREKPRGNAKSRREKPLPNRRAASGHTSPTSMS
jgi:hypothetical protein